MKFTIGKWQSVVLAGLIGSVGFAQVKTVCGTLDVSDLGSGSYLYSITQARGKSWDLEPSNKDVEKQLRNFARLRVHGHPAHVCVTGGVILEDEDKGNVLGADEVKLQNN